MLVMRDVEQRWLDYAWRVVNCPEWHKRECLAAGAVPPGDTREGRHDDLRWPGWLGHDYPEEGGILWVAGLLTPRAGEHDGIRHEQVRPAARAIPSWREAGRSGDGRFLDESRTIGETDFDGGSHARWNKGFRPFVADYMGMRATHIAWTNLAKCRAHGNGEHLARVCQSAFPARDIVWAVRPALVLVSVLNARPGGDVVDTWHCDDIDPLVWAFHGLRSTDHLGRKLGVWAPELAARISGQT